MKFDIRREKLGIRTFVISLKFRNLFCACTWSSTGPVGKVYVLYEGQSGAGGHIGKALSPESAWLSFLAATGVVISSDQGLQTVNTDGLPVALWDSASQLGFEETT